MRQQLSDPAIRLRRQPLQHIRQIRQRIEPVEFCRLNQAHDGCRPLACAQAAGEEPILAPECDLSDLVLNPVVVDRHLAIAKVMRERCPSPQAVIHRARCGRALGHLQALGFEPRVKRRGNRFCAVLPQLQAGFRVQLRRLAFHTVELAEVLQRLMRDAALIGFKQLNAKLKCKPCMKRNFENKISIYLIVPCYH